MVLLHGVNIAAFEQSWSVMVSMVSNPSDSGSLTMKSRDMVWNGSALGSGVMGNNASLLGFVFILDIWQVVWEQKGQKTRVTPYTTGSSTWWHDGLHDGQQCTMG